MTFAAQERGSGVDARFEAALSRARREVRRPRTAYHAEWSFIDHLLVGMGSTPPERLLDPDPTTTRWDENAGLEPAEHEYRQRCPRCRDTCTAAASYCPWCGLDLPDTRGERR